MVQARLLAASALTAMLIAGCGGTEIIQTNVDVSVGKQLIDLKKARDSGAMTEKEYQRQKEQLIKNVR